LFADAVLIPNLVELGIEELVVGEKINQYVPCCKVIGGEKENMIEDGCVLRLTKSIVEEIPKVREPGLEK
jgi:hypothetical protein